MTILQKTTLAFLTWITAITICLAQTSKPIALVSASYGNYEIRSVIHNVLSTSEDKQYLYEKFGDKIPISKLDQFSLIIIAHSMAEPLTQEDNDAISRYIQNGGHILLINNAPRFMAKTIGADNMTWSGIKYVSGHRNGELCNVMEEENNLLKGVFNSRPDPTWLKGGVMATVEPDGMRNIIGTTNGVCLFGIHNVGKGWVAYLGHELFRLRKLKSKTMPDSQSWIQLMSNIIAAAKPLTQSKLREQALKATEEKEILIWDREWQKGEIYGPRFIPPLPDKSEIITSLSAEMAINEYEILQLNLTPMKKLGNLRGYFEADQFPTNQIHLFVQDKPNPIPWEKNPAIAQEFPYWLMPPEYVAPKGTAEFNMHAQKTRILWIKINSFGVQPGNYPVTLHLDFAEGKHITLPISVKIYPVQIPQRRLIKLMAGGTVYGDVNNAKPAERFMENLESHGFEWSIFNAILTRKCRISDSDEYLTPKYILNHKEDFLAGNYPSLNFSAYDEWVELSIAHNQTLVRVGDIGHYLRGILTRADITGNEQLPIEQWFAEELSKYLREKGIRFMVTSIGDELHEKELKERFIPWAKRMKDAGWGCSSSFTGMIITKPEINQALTPYVNLWTLNRGTILPFTDGLKDGTLTMRPNAMLGTYGAGEGRGTEVRKIPAKSRFLGWESYMLGVKNCMPNPYFKGWIYYYDYKVKDKGIAGERFVSYLDKDDLNVPLANSPFLEGIREGIEDGNLCAILSWYLKNLPTTATTTAVKTRLQKVMGNKPDVILEWHETTHPGGYRSRIIESANSTDYQKAKHEILECLALLRSDAIKTIKPSLYWNNIELVKNGKIVTAIYATDESVDELTAKIKSLCGITLPVIRNATALDSRYPNAIVLGSGTQNSLSKKILTEYAENDATDLYPGADSYFIKELKQRDVTNGKILIVAGSNATGTAKGIKLFSMFLHAEGAWLQR